MTREAEITSLVRKSFEGQPSEFRPCAYWDADLDCIRILTRDCSISETRVNRLLTVLDATYPDRAGRRCVGFTIKGARHFCQQQGLSLNTPIEISKLLDAIITACPGTVVEAIVDHVARPLVRDAQIESVEPLSDAELVTA